MATTLYLCPLAPCCGGAAGREGGSISLRSPPYGPPSFLLVWRRLSAAPCGRTSTGALTRTGPQFPVLMGAGGPHFPYSASPARQARTRQGSGGLRESGVRLRRAFLSADASKPISQLSPRHSSWTMTASCRLTMATAVRSFPSGYSPEVTPLPERTKKRMQLPIPLDSKAASPFCGLPLVCRLPSWRR